MIDDSSSAAQPVHSHDSRRHVSRRSPWPLSFSLSSSIQHHQTVIIIKHSSFKRILNIGHWAFFLGGSYSTCPPHLDTTTDRPTEPTNQPTNRSSVTRGRAKPYVDADAAALARRAAQHAATTALCQVVVDRLFAGSVWQDLPHAEQQQHRQRVLHIIHQKYRWCWWWWWTEWSSSSFDTVHGLSGCGHSAAPRVRPTRAGHCRRVRAVARDQHLVVHQI
jgi:hypothetical protein